MKLLVEDLREALTADNVREWLAVEYCWRLNAQEASEVMVTVIHNEPGLADTVWARVRDELDEELSEALGLLGDEIVIEAVVRSLEDAAPRLCTLIEKKAAEYVAA